MPGALTLLLLLLTAPAAAADPLDSIEACLADEAACAAVEGDAPFAVALRTPADDPSPYPVYGVACQERDDCAPLAAYAAARCALREAEGCATLAALHEAGLLDGPRPVVAAALAARACAFGREESCRGLDLPPVRSFGAALDAAPPPMNFPEPGPLSLLLAACDAGAADACLALIRQLDADGPRSTARSVLLSLLDGEAQRGRASARDLVRTLRWLDEPLSPHLWAVVEPLTDACGRGLERACALGGAVVHLERASGRPPPRAALLDDTVAEPSPPPPAPPERWLEPILPLGVGVSFQTTTPLLRLGIGVRGGVGVFALSAVGSISLDAAHGPEASTYRRFDGAFSAGAALPLGDSARLHLGAGLAVGSRTTDGDPALLLGPHEAVELSWLIRGRRGPTLGFRAGSQQAWTPEGALDVTGWVEVVAGLRFPDAP